MTKKPTHHTNHVPDGRKPRSPKFKGMVVDNGAQNSCVGILQAKAYLHVRGQEVRPSTCAFRFGDAVANFQVSIMVSISTEYGNELEFVCEVVNVYIPLLLDLEVMRCEDGHRHQGSTIERSRMVSTDDSRTQTLCLEEYREGAVYSTTASETSLALPTSVSF